MKKEMEEKKMEEELIFRPQLISKPIRDKSLGTLNTQSNRPESCHGNYVKKEEQLLQYGQRLNEKKEMARMINMQYEESKFDFVPKINKRSEQIVEEKTKYLMLQQQQQIHQFSPDENGAISPIQVEQVDKNQRDLSSPKNLKNLEDQLRYIGMTGLTPNEISPEQQMNYPNLLLSPTTKSAMKERKFLELYEEAK